MCQNLTNEAVNVLCQHQTGLTTLDLSGCSELTDQAVLTISSHLLHLQYLHLGKLPRITEAGFQKVSHLRQLQSLDVSECSLVSCGELVKAFSAVEGCPRLVSLNVAFCSLLQIISFPELRFLSLSLVPNLTDTSLLAVAHKCRSLEHLSLSHCVNLTDEGFVEAARSLRRLQHLVVSGCNQLTPRILKAVGQECQQLKSLDVSMCSKINMVDVDLFQSQLPPQSQTSIQSRFVGGADLSITL
ncbi:hypothetical protein JRQ81_006283 [Phrynocephalus forsythii]|uniref:Leucine rich repeat containing 29 n=1 Tax=Phrynocephalus forsythii TaxID=171643 RepID=A0A9Q0XEN8_9SAUR|nr:hypothetical protein JRQ81_006283 [Phrynocephalus forsythii]